MLASAVVLVGGRSARCISNSDDDTRGTLRAHSRHATWVFALVCAGSFQFFACRSEWKRFFEGAPLTCVYLHVETCGERTSVIFTRCLVMSVTASFFPAFVPFFSGTFFSVITDMPQRRIAAGEHVTEDMMGLPIDPNSHRTSTTRIHSAKGSATTILGVGGTATQRSEIGGCHLSLPKVAMLMDKVDMTLEEKRAALVPNEQDRTIATRVMTTAEGPVLISYTALQQQVKVLTQCMMTMLEERGRDPQEAVYREQPLGEGVNKQALRRTAALRAIEVAESGSDQRHVGVIYREMLQQIDAMPEPDGPKDSDAPKKKRGRPKKNASVTETTDDASTAKTTKTATTKKTKKAGAKDASTTEDAAPQPLGPPPKPLASAPLAPAPQKAPRVSGVRLKGPGMMKPAALVIDLVSSSSSELIVATAAAASDAKRAEDEAALAMQEMTRTFAWFDDEANPEEGALDISPFIVSPHALSRSPPRGEGGDAKRRLNFEFEGLDKDIDIDGDMLMTLSPLPAASNMCFPDTGSVVDGGLFAGLVPKPPSQPLDFHAAIPGSDYDPRVGGKRPRNLPQTRKRPSVEKRPHVAAPSLGGKIYSGDLTKKSDVAAYIRQLGITNSHEKDMATQILWNSWRNPPYMLDANIVSLYERLNRALPAEDEEHELAQ